VQKVYEHIDGEVVKAEALKLLDSLKDDCASVVFLDPPFNLGKRYGDSRCSDDRMSEADYLSFLCKMITRSAQVLKPGGTLFAFHIPKWAIFMAYEMEKQLDFRHWIAVSLKNGFVRGRHLYPAHYALLYYSKGVPISFNRPKVPKPICFRCKRDLKDYGGYKDFVKDGINLSDVWDDISPVRHSKYKHRCENELPETLADRILTISAERGGLLVDPFAGSGTMLVAAARNGMYFVGGDKDAISVQAINARLKAHTCTP